MPHSEHPIVRRFIEEAGNATQALGSSRLVGQIFAFLYFSPSARTLDDIKEALAISKGSASVCVRQLEAWGAVQRVWVKGDRKDYYAANDYFGQIVRNIMLDMVGKRLESLSGVLLAADAELSELFAAGDNGEKETEFLRDRIQRLRRFEEKAVGAWNNPLLKMILK